MAYNRQPQTVLAGGALKQNPPTSVIQPPGVVPVTLDVDIATTTSIGVVQVGSGLSITPEGILSATGGSSSYVVNIKIVSTNYMPSSTDYFIGCSKKDIEITLPTGVLGRVYVIKNQAEGSVKVKCSSGQTIDGSATKSLGSENSITVVFDGTRWNVIQ